MSKSRLQIGDTVAYINEKTFNNYNVGSYDPNFQITGYWKRQRYVENVRARYLTTKSERTTPEINNLTTIL